MAVNTRVIRHRVHRGATLLDDRIPGWHRRVDPSTLDLTDCLRCTLGQVFADVACDATDEDDWTPYETGLHTLGMLTFDDDGAPHVMLHDPVALGFCAESPFGTRACHAEYRRLTQAWHDAVTNRQARDHTTWQPRPVVVPEPRPALESTP